MTNALNPFRLRKSKIGSGLTNLGFPVFSHCVSLTGVYFTSNAPGGNSEAFDADNAAIAYYLPVTTGGGATFDGLPTALRLPQITDVAVRGTTSGAGWWCWSFGRLGAGLASRPSRI